MLISLWTGTLTSDLNPAFDDTFTAGAQRVVGDLLGHYSSSKGYKGIFRHLQVSGTAHYDRTNHRIRFQTLVSTVAGATVDFRRVTSYTIVSSNEVRVAPFTLQPIPLTSNLYTLSEPLVLTRTFNRYEGTLRLKDGEPLTSWPDYNEWPVTLKDESDVDFDRVPDFSDSDTSPYQLESFRLSSAPSQNPDGTRGVKLSAEFLPRLPPPTNVTVWVSRDLTNWFPFGEPQRIPGPLGFIPFGRPPFDKLFFRASIP